MSVIRTPRGSQRAIAVLVLLALAVVVTLAARTRPSFDAYGWLDWGRMTLHGGLNTNAAPSWKPLPWLFTVVFGLLGRALELWLWMITVTFVSFAGLVWAGRLAWTLAGSAGGAGGAALTPNAPRGAARPLAGGLAAVLAGLALLSVHDQYPFGYLHYVLSAQSDPMIVAFLLGAADCRLRDRPRAAFALLLAASLGRPEAWPFLLAGAVWLWRARPEARWAVLGGCAATALLWFGIPALTSRSWFVAADNAGASGYAPRGDALQRAITVLARLVFQVPWAIWAAAAGAVALAAWRRERTTLRLAAALVLWVAVEVAFGLHRWPALGRYMFEPSAVVVVLGASLAGRLIGAAIVAPPGGRTIGAARLPGPHVPRATLALAGLGIVAGTVPALVHAARLEAHDLGNQQARTAQLDALLRTIDRLGGPGRLRHCGEVISAGPAPGSALRPSIGLGGQTPLAFDVGENVNRVGYIFPQPGHPHNPIVVFHPRGDGWVVHPLRQTSAACRGLGARSR